MEENGVWRTVGGHRIFIKEGQDLASAMKESGKFSKKQVEDKKIDNEKQIIDENTEKFSKRIMNQNRESAIVFDDESKEKIFENEETIKRLKNITKSKEINRLNCCKEVSEEVKKIAEENNIKAEVVQVTVFNEDGMKERNSHYVTKINGKLYDYTGKQFLGSNNPDDIELRIYKKISNNFYAEDDLKINTLEEAIEYTEKNKDKLIFYRE